MKKVCRIGLLIICIMCVVSFCACDEDWLDHLPNLSFSGRWKTSEDGYKYYVDDEIGLCIMEFPDQEEITIPEYIDGMKVVQLGCKTKNPHLGEPASYEVRSGVKRLTITYELDLYGSTRVRDLMLSDLEILILVDCWNICNNYNYDKDPLTAFRIDFSTPDWGNFTWVHPEIHLIKDKKDIAWDNEEITVIEISHCVTVIECGTFDSVKNVVIRTEWESQPKGWQDGWNSGLEVEWGVTFE